MNHSHLEAYDDNCPVVPELPDYYDNFYSLRPVNVGNEKQVRNITMV
jgi:hypothetical protein